MLSFSEITNCIAFDQSSSSFIIAGLIFLDLSMKSAFDYRNSYKDIK